MKYVQKKIMSLDLSNYFHNELFSYDEEGSDKSTNKNNKKEGQNSKDQKKINEKLTSEDEKKMM